MTGSVLLLSHKGQEQHHEPCEQELQSKQLEREWEEQEALSQAQVKEIQLEVLQGVK